MTREEAIVLFEKQLTAAQVVLDSGFGSNPGENDSLYRRRKEMAEIALTALRPVSREQVEKVERMRGEWVKPHWRNSTSCAVCSQCGFEAYHHEYHGVQDTYLFCPSCGAPMTDEAVQILIERMEKLKNALRSTNQEQLDVVINSLKLRLENNEENNVVNIPKFAVEEMIKRLEILRDG